MTATILAVPSAARPLLSVVVVTHGRLELVRECLAAVAAAASVPTEVVVVDNASSDGTAEWVTGLDGAVVALNDRNEGFGAGANRGVALARGAYVALLNSDAVVPTGWDERLVGVLAARPDLVAAVPRYIGDDGLVWESGALLDGRADARQVAAGTRPDQAVGAGRRCVGHGSAATMVLRREAFLWAGGFDPAYGLGYYEDADLVRRWSRAGLGVAVEPSVLVRHARGASSTEDTKLALLDRNRLRFARRWGPSLAGVPGGAVWDEQPERRADLLAWWSDAQVCVDARIDDAGPVAAAVAAVRCDVHVAVVGATGSVPDGVSAVGETEVAWTTDPLVPEVVVTAADAPRPGPGRAVVAPAGGAEATAAVVIDALASLGVPPRPPEPAAAS